MKIVVLKIFRDLTNQTIGWATIGLFDKDGRQTVSFLVSGNCFDTKWEIREGMELIMIPVEAKLI